MEQNRIRQACVSTRPLIQDPDGEFSGCCRPRVGQRDLDKIHRTLPVVTLDNEDEEVLQDEDGLAVNDEITANYIYDDLKA